jgi:deoxyribodipyrimidine photo-lyase
MRTATSYFQQQNQQTMRKFGTQKSDIDALLHAIDPIAYAKSRNFLDGAVTYLSPYISRGVLTTRRVFEHLKNQNYSWEDVEKLVQELAWRDFFQLVWMRLGDDINQDIKQPQEQIKRKDLPSALLTAETGIEAIDSGIQTLVESGYMHNHVRMYTASVACNIGRFHWLEPARWMYFHLLDADWSSNACSWQWVAGAFSQKKYFANQENINKYVGTKQMNSYLDVSYEEIAEVDIPVQLMQGEKTVWTTNLPETEVDFHLSSDLPTLIYNWYNLDFEWHKEKNCNRVLLLEPSVFERYPVGDKSIKFMLDLAQNINGIQLFVGEFEELRRIAGESTFIFKEHPLNQYDGLEESRNFLTPIASKSFNSFFGFWKSIEKQLRADFEKR